MYMYTSAASYIAANTILRAEIPLHAVLKLRLGHFHMSRRKLNRGRISIHPKATDDGHGLVAKVAVLPPRLARVDVGDVQLHKRDLDAEQGVAHRDAGVGQPARVDDYGRD